MIILASLPSDNPFNEWLKNYGIVIASILAGVVFVTVLILFIVAMVKNKKNPVVPAKKAENIVFFDEIFACLGGKENIVSSKVNGSRVTVELKNTKLIKEKDITKCGVSNYIVMSNKIVLVSEKNSQDIFNILNN